MGQQIHRETLTQILQARDVEVLPFPELVRLFREEAGITDYLPDGVCQVDPRNGDRILFNSSRAHRPHDNRPALSAATTELQACIVCQGQTTGVIDVAELSEGFTFINKNRYPSLYPLPVGRSDLLADERGTYTESERIPRGLHFLQWTSSLHDRDWHNIPLADCVVVLQRLAALERELLTDARGFFSLLNPTRSGTAARAMF